MNPGEIQKKVEKYPAVGLFRETIFEDLPDSPTRDLMDFTLVYWDTTLKAANRSKGRAWEKHQIRRNLSEQLENLWKTHPSLKTLDPRGEQRDVYAKQFKIADMECVPLVLEKWSLLCELDIIFLLSGKSQIVFDGGDIDNRLKTLLDALRRPHNGFEMPVAAGESNPSRLYCLLEDDRLITRIRVTSDRLLTAPDGEQEICATIRVRITGTNLLNSPWEFK